VAEAPNEKKSLTDDLTPSHLLNHRPIQLYSPVAERGFVHDIHNPSTIKRIRRGLLVLPVSTGWDAG
jgi:hypothetical protein